MGALVLLASWTVGAISSMSRNWELEQKLQNRQLSAARLQIEVETLKLEQQYYKTSEYQELMAREKQNKKLAGETVVILPKNSEAAKDKYSETKVNKQRQKSNFRQWLDFLFS